MSLSCTISEILSIISLNLNRPRDSDHAHLRDYLSIRRLILHTFNQRRKFEVSKPFQRYLRGIKNLKWFMWCDHAPFRDSLSSYSWGFLWATWTPNLKSLRSNTTKRNAKCSNWGGLGKFWVTKGHRHRTSNSTLIETMRPSCTVLELQPVISQKSPAFWRQDLWQQKTTALSCGAVSIIRHLAVLTQYRRVTDRQTDTWPRLTTR